MVDWNTIIRENFGQGNRLDAPPTILSDWQKARLGKITGSNFHRVTRGRGGKGWSQTAETYLYELVYEHATQTPANQFSGSAATEWGKDHEAEAIRVYEKITDEKVEIGKFYKAPGFKLVGCTPDGVGRKGLEIKCPYGPKNHIRAIINKAVPEEYEDQVQGHMLCTERDLCDFVSYDPRFPAGMQIVIVNVERNPSTLHELRERLAEFEQLLIETLAQLGIGWENF